MLGGCAEEGAQPHCWRDVNWCGRYGEQCGGSLKNIVRQRERPGLHSPAVAWPPRLSAGRRESGSQRPWLGEAASQPEGSSVCAQKAPARLGKNSNVLTNQEVKVVQLCLTLCDPMNYTVHGILQARILEWWPFPSPGDLPNPGIKPSSPALQADSLPAEPKGKPKNTGVGSLFPSPGDLPDPGIKPR